jgi:type III secretion protein C
LNASTYTGRLGLNSHDRLTTTSHIAQNPTIGTGDVRISVDPRLNAIIVRDSAERMSHYQTLIDALDVEPQMVEIEASIIDISTDKLKEMGVDWRGIKGNEEFLVGSADGLSPAGVVTGGGEGGILSFVTGNSYQFIGKIEALEKDGAAQIVSQPQVVTLSNVEAAFDNSSTFFVRVQCDEEVDLYDVSVGTSLRVTPHVFKDNGEVKIKLLVRINDGSQQAQQVDNIPVVSHSTINTQAIIQANESVLVGGLVREVSSESENRVPILGSIPLLGRLFRSEREHKERVERMFLITPRLINSSRLSSASSDKFEGVRLVQPQESAE